ncbi:MAG TPA: hypothetical protein VNQ77_15885 [Frankiaceae bacterium]|nr:hypothetical protein [Frankiaceae bacterium]
MDNAGDVFNGAGYVLILSTVTRGHALLAALVLSATVACSDPKAGTLPSVSPSASTPSATPSPTAKRHPDDRQQVRTAIETYFAALNAALRQPSRAEELLGPLVATTCECRKILGVMSELARDNHYLDYRYTVADIEIQQVGDAGASVTYSVAQSAGHERRADDSVVKAYPASKARYSAHLQRGGTAWLLDRSDVMT